MSALAPPEIAVLAAFVALSFGAITHIAAADHFHKHGGGNNHGVVHGSSTTDSNYHARVEAGPVVHSAWCVVGQWDTAITGGWTSAGATCNAFAYQYGPECAGTAYVEQPGPGGFGWHKHRAHSPC